ncbi:MAG: hypothetical protein IKD89_07730 [Clostridia bacterium]|nr:hypothetical protein [Clostridia bacterium]
MGEISTNRILDGISLAIRAAYPDAHIASEEIKQGIMLPAFVITLSSSEQKCAPCGRIKMRADFEVRYFPEGGDRQSCHDAADVLYGALRRIRLASGDGLWGTRMSFNVCDGVLHFFVSYSCVGMRAGDEKELMGELFDSVELSFNGEF